jgi:glycosyltransferase involved in cell wall biosynthesis
MASGRPVLAIAPVDSGLAGIISRHNIGRAFEKNNTNAMRDFILEMKSNPKLKETYGENALKASENYTKANADRYLQYFMN